YELPLGEGQVARLAEDGGVDILQTFPNEGPESAVLVSRVEKPWAVDADGRSVPTRFEVEGDSITQVVQHNSTHTYPVVADPFWVPAIIIGLRVAAHVVVKVGSRTVRYAVAPASRVVNALRSFQTLSFRTGSHTFRLDKSAMKHILERHHPNYWNGTTKSTQTFFNPSMSINDVRSTVHAALQQHQATLRVRGTNARISLSGKVNGINYQMVVDQGRVVQFYPK
ncbi:MAG: hypothetical protein Q4G46_06930, partial [Propionibacteriaceae bacterium]|nr:hypothetical protein [Propionibacteriaceae bacterium]